MYLPINIEIFNDNEHPFGHVLSVSCGSNEAEVCIPCLTLNGSVQTAPTTLVDPLQNPVENNDLNVRDVDQLILYIEKECCEGSKWSRHIMVKGSINLTKFSEIDVIKYVGNLK